MCGLFALFQKDCDFSEKEFSQFSTLKLLSERGPDQQNIEKLQHSFLFHSRLLTLSHANDGRQPVLRGKKSMLFNGNIYNFKDFGDYTSDTDALFDSLDSQGVSAMNKCNGSFSICFSDGEVIQLIRDRIGVRQLYYTILVLNGRQSLAVSTSLVVLAQLRSNYGNKLTRSRKFFSQYRALRYGVCDSPFEEIKSVGAGEIIQFRWADILSEKLGTPTTKKYWSLDELNGLSHKESSVENLGLLLEDAIKIRSQCFSSNLGSFLSGGIDSGVITRVAAREQGFLHAYYLSLPGSTNEDDRLERYLRAHPVKVKKLTYSSKHSETLFQRLEVPFGDSIIYLVDQLVEQASKEVKVVLSGDGADEVFGGYIHHRVFFYAQLLHRFFPKLGRNLIINLIESLPLTFWNTFFPYNQSLDQGGLKKFFRFLTNFDSPVKAYLSLVALCDDFHLDDFSEMSDAWPCWSDFSIRDLIIFDLKFWSPQYSLFKMDRIGLSRGLDIRVPFFDHRLVEWSLSQKKFTSLREGKTLLRQAIKRVDLLSKELSDEAKFPFRLSDKDLHAKELDLVAGKKETCLLHERKWSEAMQNLGISYEENSCE